LSFFPFNFSLKGGWTPNRGGVHIFFHFAFTFPIWRLRFLFGRLFWRSVNCYSGMEQTRGVNLLGGGGYFLMTPPGHEMDHRCNIFFWALGGWTSIWVVVHHFLAIFPSIPLKRGLDFCLDLFRWFRDRTSIHAWNKPRGWTFMRGRGVFVDYPP